MHRRRGHDGARRGWPRRGPRPSTSVSSSSPSISIPSLTAVENVMLPLELAGRPDARAGGGEGSRQRRPRRRALRIILSSCPAANSSASRLRAPSSHGRPCCSPMSRPAISTPPPASASSICCSTEPRHRQHARSSSPTIRALATRCERRTRARRGPHAGGRAVQILRFALRNLWRDLKSGEISVLLSALTVAVLSLTAVGFFTSRISQGVRAQAAEVLAADLRIESRDPTAARAISQAARAADCAARRSADVPDRDLQRRAQPIGGAAMRSRRDIRCAGRCASPTRRSAPRAPSTRYLRAAKPGSTRGFSRSSISRSGASCASARASFRVAHVLDYRPDQGTGFVNLAPAVLMNAADVAATGLIQPGSRVTYAAIVRGHARRGRRVSRLPGREQGAGRAPARRRRVRPPIELRDRARGPISEPGEPRVGAARGRRRRDGCAALHRPAYRGRRVDEMHGGRRSASSWRSRSSSSAWSRSPR